MKCFFKIILILFYSISFKINAQVDTIFTNSEIIPCVIREVTTDAVKFSYVGEDLLNTFYKNSIVKIKMKSGRVQIFSESTSFKKVKDVSDYENVTFSQVESEIRGLYKIGDVSAKAKGTTLMSNQGRVMDRAYRKIKMQAALMGANVIFLTNQREDGNKGGGYYQSGTSSETSISGIAYSNQIPNFNVFINRIGNKRTFIPRFQDYLHSGGTEFISSTIVSKLKISEIINESGFIILKANLEDSNSLTNRYRVVSFDDNNFNITYESKNTVYNITIPFND